MCGASDKPLHHLNMVHQNHKVLRTNTPLFRLQDYKSHSQPPEMGSSCIVLQRVNLIKLIRNIVFNFILFCEKIIETLYN